MSCEKFKIIPLCVGGRHQSATISFESDVAKTCEKFLISKCVHWIRKKLMTVSENTIAAECLRKFSKKSGRSSAKVGRKFATTVLNNTARSLGIGKKIGGAAVFNIAKAVSSQFQM